MLSPIAWRTPPRHYGPREQFASRKIADLAFDRFAAAPMIDKYIEVYRGVIGNRK